MAGAEREKLANAQVCIEENADEDKKGGSGKVADNIWERQLRRPRSAKLARLSSKAPKRRCPTSGRPWFNHAQTRVCKSLPCELTHCVRR